MAPPAPPALSGRLNRAVPTTVFKRSTIVRTYTPKGTLTSVITNGHSTPLGYGRPSRLDILAAAAQQLSTMPPAPKPQQPQLPVVETQPLMDGPKPPSKISQRPKTPVPMPSPIPHAIPYLTPEGYIVYMPYTS